MIDEPAEERDRHHSEGRVADAAGQGDLPADPTFDEVADYIVDMLHELRELAKASGLGPLGAILDSAERQARRDPGTPSSSTPTSN